MPLIVDGDNLLGTWRGRKRSDAERRSLAFELSRFSQRTRRRVKVVFDGSAPPGEGHGTNVEFAGPSSTADDLILAFLRRQSDAHGWTVVTSDRSLGDQCRYLKATVVRSDQFRKRLTADPATEKPERESDVEYWLEQFGSSPGD